MRITGYINIDKDLRYDKYFIPFRTVHVGGEVLQPGEYMRFTDIGPLSVVEFDCLMIAVPVSNQE